MRYTAIFLLLGILGRYRACGQLATPTQQTVGVSFPKPGEVSVVLNDVAPFIPLEFKGIWPPNVTQLTIKLLNTTDVDYETFNQLYNDLRPFDFGWSFAASKKQVDELLPTTDTSKFTTADTLKKENERRKKLYDKPGGLVYLHDYYDFKTIKREKDQQEFTVRLAAPQLRRYYGVEILAEDTSGKRDSVLYATQDKENSRAIPLLYSGALDLLPQERFIPYSSIGVGFLGIKDDRAYPFLTTSLGILVTASPVYTGQRHPFVHHIISSGWRKPFLALKNRAYFLGGISTATLNYRGQTLASSTVKGTVGAGIFLLPGLGLSYNFTFGGTVNYNPTFDSRTNPFYMSGVSLTLTGQVAELFKTSIGSGINPQPSK